jgi:hypothetical protein
MGIGDKVRVIKQYDSFEGFIGIITRIENDMYYVSFDGGFVDFPFTQFDLVKVNM